jgi:alpha-tubulin suppressor-like RCC1 family protein
MGQAGDGNQYLAVTPVKVVDLAAKAQAIAAAYKTTCAQLADGSVGCWGSGDWGLFGNGSNTPAISPTPISVPLPGAASGVAVTQDHACTSVSSVLTCWGSNNEGEIGTGTATSGLLQATGSIAQDGFGVGSDFTCALIGGAVKCWGTDSEGQIGNGTTSTTPVSTPTTVPSLSGVVSLGVGLSDVCAVTAAGKVLCWGFNGDGEVGNGTTSTGLVAAVSTPVQVSTLSTASAVCSGNSHSCALVADGTVWCWGANFGASPVQIPGW